VCVISFAIGLLLTHFMRPFMERWKWKQLGWRASCRAWSAPQCWAPCLAVHREPLAPRDARASLEHQVPAGLVLTLQVCDGAVLLFAWLCLYFFYHCLTG